MSLRDVKIAYIEDESTSARVVSKWIKDAEAKLQVFTCYSEMREALEGPTGWAHDTTQTPDILVTDLILPDGSGIQALASWRKYFPQKPVIIVTAFATVENAVECLKAGAFDFLQKPVTEQELILSLEKAYEHGSLIQENEILSSAVRVFGIAQTLASITDKMNLLKTLGRLLHRELNSDESFVFFYQSGKTSECILECRKPGITRTNTETIKNEVTRYTPETPVVIAGPQHIDLLQAPQYEVHQNSKNNAVVIELQSPSENKGFVVLSKREKGNSIQINPELQPVLMQAAKGFLSADLAERMADFSYIDDLTGLYNQRYLRQALDNEIQRSSRFGTSIALMFLDLDGFKSINDTYGHLVGSALLKGAAHVLRSITRDTDILLRFGGDEFVVILPNTKSNGAALMAERIRKAIYEKSFDVREETGVKEAFNLKVTASIGYACYPENAKDAQEFIHLADSAMYEAKRLGKNRVVFLERKKEEK